MNAAHGAPHMQASELSVGSYILRRVENGVRDDPASGTSSEKFAARPRLAGTAGGFTNALMDACITARAYARSNSNLTLTDDQSGACSDTLSSVLLEYRHGVCWTRRRRHRCRFDRRRRLYPDGMHDQPSRAAVARAGEPLAGALSTLDVDPKAIWVVRKPGSVSRLDRRCDGRRLLSAAPKEANDGRAESHNPHRPSPSAFDMATQDGHLPSRHGPIAVRQPLALALQPIKLNGRTTYLKRRRLIELHV